MISANTLAHGASRFQCRDFASRPRPCRQRAMTVPCMAGLRARWCIDIRYGCKQDATVLLQEWVRDVGAVAGLSADNTHLSSGSIGVPESRLELEVRFSTLSEWEQFLNSIPFREHKAWSQRIQSMITNDNSPKWEVFREIPVDMDPPPQSSATAASSSTSASRGVAAPPLQLRAPMPRPSNVPESISVAVGTAESSGLMLIEDGAAAEVILDWKGEPMRINPGDKLPFKFL